MTKIGTGGVDTPNGGQIEKMASRQPPRIKRIFKKRLTLKIEYGIINTSKERGNEL